MNFTIRAITSGEQRAENKRAFDGIKRGLEPVHVLDIRGGYLADITDPGKDVMALAKPGRGHQLQQAIKHPEANLRGKIRVQHHPLGRGKKHVAQHNRKRLGQVTALMMRAKPGLDGAVQGGLATTRVGPIHDIIMGKDEQMQ